MTPCRTCNQPWDSSESRFTVCPTCRAKMPVRRVNTEPLNRRWRPPVFDSEYYVRLNPEISVYSLPLS